MATRVVWTGMNEYKQLLLQMPDTMSGEAAKLAESTANSAAFDIRSVAPVVTGNFQKSVQVVKLNRGRYQPGSQVKITAPHSHLIEWGTKLRQTKGGANRGRMPALRLIIPRIIKWRQRYTDLLKAALLRHGATRVSG